MYTYICDIRVYREYTHTYTYDNIHFNKIFTVRNFYNFFLHYLPFSPGNGENFELLEMVREVAKCIKMCPSPMLVLYQFNATTIYTGATTTEDDNDDCDFHLLPRSTFTAIFLCGVFE